MYVLISNSVSRLWKQAGKQKWKTIQDRHDTSTEFKLEDEYMNEEIRKQTESEFVKKYVNGILRSGFMSRYIVVLKNILMKNGISIVFTIFNFKGMVPSIIVRCAVISMGKVMKLSIKLAKEMLPIIVSLAQETDDIHLLCNVFGKNVRYSANSQSCDCRYAYNYTKCC